MLKLLGVMLVLGASAMVGISASQVLMKRRRALDAMISTIDFISSEIECRRTPIPTLIDTLAQTTHALSAQIFRVMQQKMSCADGLSLTYKWCRAFIECRESVGMDMEETQLLCDVSSFLGKYDAEEQIKSLDYTRKQLCELRIAAEQDVKSRGKLYRTYGLAVGAVMVLVLL